jgi:enoyl-CoA hydratase/carnithine racemase
MPITVTRREGGAVATVTVDNEAKLNVLGAASMRELVGAMAALSDDDALRAVVLTGAGERAFIGGMDINDMARLSAATAGPFIELVHRACAVMRECPVPVIARIRGYALGGGLEIAAACDLRVATTDSRFGMPEVKVGIPSVVEAALLPGLVGWGRTCELLYTGETIDAATALAWGLVEEVVEPASLDASVERRLAAILAAGPRAIRIQKRLMQRWEDQNVSQAIRSGVDAFVESWATDEPKRLMQDFLDRRAAAKRER